MVYKIENQEILATHIAMVEYAKAVIESYLGAEGKKTLKQVLV
jgi:hypothetical protein